MRRLLLALALVAALSGCGSGAHGVPRGFRPETAAAAGASDIWVLGQGNTLVRSTDAGAHFERVAFPALPTQGNVPVIEFATPQTGYAYERGSRLYVTRDGGSSWQAALGGVLWLALGDRYVYALTKQGLERSPVARDVWMRLPYRTDWQRDSIAARGSHVWLLGAPRRGQDSTTLAISNDRGRSFTSHTGPCFYDLPGTVVPAGGNAVWAVCPSGMMAGLSLSTDDGRTFPAVRSFHDPGGLSLPPLTNGARIAPFSPRAAILDGGAQSPLLRTTNRGRNWTPVQPTKLDELLWLGSATHRVGYALTSNKLWRTSDAGASWHVVPIR